MEAQLSLGIVVDQDPAQRCHPGVGAVIPLHRATPLIIGRAPENLLSVSSGRVARRSVSLGFDGGAWVVVDLGSTNGVVVNGARLRHRASLCPGDVLEFDDVVVRVVAFDPLEWLSPCGSWVRIGTRLKTAQAGRAFRVRETGIERSWLVSVDDDLEGVGPRLLHAYAEAAPRTGVAVVDEWLDHRDRHVAFALPEVIDVAHLFRLARPVSARVALAVFLRLMQAVRIVLTATQTDLDVKAGVSFDGRVLLVPGVPRLTRGGSSWAASVLGELLQLVVVGGDPADEPFRLAQQKHRQAPGQFSDLEGALWPVAHAVGVASDEEVAAVVTGLFAAEVAAAAELDARMRKLTPADVAERLR